MQEDEGGDERSNYVCYVGDDLSEKNRRDSLLGTSLLTNPISLMTAHHREGPPI